MSRLSLALKESALYEKSRRAVDVPQERSSLPVGTEGSDGTGQRDRSDPTAL